MKRLADLCLALLGLPAAALLIVPCMVVVWITSPGPVILRQVRIGRHEKPFVCLKLRTMYADTPQLPSHKLPASAVTPAGRWMRRLKLDELPQLWNVVRGDMSFVGPRPSLPSQTQLIMARRERGLYALRPGITGVAQVAGIDMSDPVRLADAEAVYLKTMSLALDLRLIFASIIGAGRGDRVRS